MTRTVRRRPRPLRSKSIVREFSVDVVDYLLHAWFRWIIGCRCRLASRWRGTSSSAALLIAHLAAQRLDERCDKDTRLIEHVQRHRLEDEGDRVARKERRDGGTGQDCVAAVLAQ